MHAACAVWRARVHTLPLHSPRQVTRETVPSGRGRGDAREDHGEGAEEVGVSKKKDQPPVRKKEAKQVREKGQDDQKPAADIADEAGDSGAEVGVSRGGQQKSDASDVSEGESAAQDIGGERAAESEQDAGEESEQDAGDESAAALPPSAPSPDHVLAVSPAAPSKKQVVDGWQPGEKSVLATGVDGELVVLLAPWETIHLVGSLRVLVLAGSCTVFGARLSAAAAASGSGRSSGGAATAGSFHDVHAVPPFGPMGLEAAGRATSTAALDRSAMARHGVGAAGHDSHAAQQRTVDELETQLDHSRQSPVACVLCLRRWRHEQGGGATAGAGDSVLTWLKGR